MNITIHHPEECTLTEWADMLDANVIVGRRATGGCYAFIDCENELRAVGTGCSPEFAVKNMAKTIAGGILLINGKRCIVPKLTGIRTAGDWESFTVGENA